jgi:hypothetical protein
LAYQAVVLTVSVVIPVVVKRRKTAKEERGSALCSRGQTTSTVHEPALGERRDYAKTTIGFITYNIFICQEI